MTVIAFDAASHAYYVGGVRKPNVTSILDGAGLGEVWGSGEQLAYARDLGKAVHLATELLDRGTLDRQTVVPVVQPYLEAYERFLAVHTPEIVAIEERVYHHDLDYAGTIDRAMVFRGQFRRKISAIVDLKTGVKRRATGPQTAAYLRAFAPRHYGNWKRYALHLRDNGRYELVPYASEMDWHVFCAALTLHRWKEAA